MRKLPILLLLWFLFSCGETDLSRQRLAKTAFAADEPVSVVLLMFQDRISVKAIRNFYEPKQPQHFVRENVVQVKLLRGKLADLEILFEDGKRFKARILPTKEQDSYEVRPGEQSLLIYN